MAVYTTPSFHEAADCIARYTGATLQRLLPIASGIENSNFFADFTSQDDNAKRAILTIFEKRTSGADLPFFMALMQHLASAIPCPQPFSQTDTHNNIQYIDTLCGKPCALTSFLPGKAIAAQDCNSTQAYAFGVIVASMHMGVSNFTQTRANSMGVATWQHLSDACMPHLQNTQATLLQNTLTESIAFQHQAQKSLLPTGVIHADLFPDNVFFIEDAVSGVIDFYFACTDTLIYDLAITLNAWCMDDSQWQYERALALIAGYQTIRLITPAEWEALPTLLRTAALRFWLTRLYDARLVNENALLTPKDPSEYEHILRYHHHNRDISWLIP